MVSALANWANDFWVTEVVERNWGLWEKKHALAAESAVSVVDLLRQIVQNFLLPVCLLYSSSFLGCMLLSAIGPATSAPMTRHSWQLSCLAPISQLALLNAVCRSATAAPEAKNISLCGRTCLNTEPGRESEGERKHTGQLSRTNPERI